jgi:hypothetical protein
VPLWDRGPDCYARVSSNLLRHAKITLYSGHRHFCANLLNLSKFRCCVKPGFCWNQDYNSSSSAGSFTCLFDRHSGEVSRPQKVALRKISKSDRHQMPSATKAHERASSRVMQWVCSLRDSLQGLDELTLPIRPTNRLPTSLYSSLAALKRAGPTATGRLHCYICNFLRVAQATPRCKSRNRLNRRAVSRLPENINGPRTMQLMLAVERKRFLWETPSHARGISTKNAPDISISCHNNHCALGGSNRAYCRGMTPRSVSPFTKNCMASATSNRPMMRTRIRIPVSPSTARTRPAPASTK